MKYYPTNTWMENNYPFKLLYLRSTYWIIFLINAYHSFCNQKLLFFFFTLVSINDQIPAWLLVPQQLRWNFIPPVLFSTSSWSSTKLLGLPSDHLCYINIPCTFRYVDAFIEIMQQNMPNTLLCHVHYSFHKMSVRPEEYLSEFALSIRTRNNYYLL